MPIKIFLKQTTVIIKHGIRLGISAVSKLVLQTFTTVVSLILTVCPTPIRQICNFSNEKFIYLLNLWENDFFLHFSRLATEETNLEARKSNLSLISENKNVKRLKQTQFSTLKIWLQIKSIAFLVFFVLFLSLNVLLDTTLFMWMCIYEKALRIDFWEGMWEGIKQ